VVAVEGAVARKQALVAVERMQVVVHKQEQVAVVHTQVVERIAVERMQVAVRIVVERIEEAVVHKLAGRKASVEAVVARMLARSNRIPGLQKQQD
jgi:hypothetical protein